MKKILTLLLSVLAVASAYGEIKVKQTLQITITGVPISEQGRLNSSYPVSTDGYIEMWKIGRVRASGLTSAQLATSIASKFRAAQIYSSPVFQVLNPADLSDEARKKQQVEDTQKFTIGGQVKAAGQRQWTKGLTLYAAIQSAGGETTYGATNRVKLYRNRNVYTYNLKVDAHKSVKVYPKDIIEVPQKNWLNK